MVNISNISTIKELRKAALISNSEASPIRLAESIVPVIDINPSHNRCINVHARATTTTTGASTIYTTSSTKSFYLTSALLTNQSNATADNTLIALRCNVPSNLSLVGLLEIAKQTTTATAQTIALNYNPPILLTKNTAIDIISSFTVGGSTTSGTITGFEIDVSES